MEDFRVEDAQVIYDLSKTTIGAYFRHWTSRFQQNLEFSISLKTSEFVAATVIGTLITKVQQEINANNRTSFLTNHSPLQVFIYVELADKRSFHVW